MKAKMFKEYKARYIGLLVKQNYKNLVSFLADVN